MVNFSPPRCIKLLKRPQNTRFKKKLSYWSKIISINLDSYGPSVLVDIGQSRSAISLSVKFAQCIGYRPPTYYNIRQTYFNIRQTYFNIRQTDFDIRQTYFNMCSTSTIIPPMSVNTRPTSVNNWPVRSTIGQHWINNFINNTPYCLCVDRLWFLLLFIQLYIKMGESVGTTFRV